MEKFLITFFWHGFTRQETIQATDWQEACSIVRTNHPEAKINRVQDAA